MTPGNAYSYNIEDVLLKVNENIKNCYGALSDASGKVLTVLNRGNNLVAYTTMTQQGSITGSLIVILA